MAKSLCIVGLVFIAFSFLKASEDYTVDFFKDLGMSDSLAQVEYENYRKRLCYKKASELKSLSELDTLSGFSEEEKDFIRKRYELTQGRLRRPNLNR